MAFVFGIILLIMAITMKVSADARLIGLCLWLIAVEIEAHK